MHRAPPTAAHHALMTDLSAILARYQSMPVIERIAILAQQIGGEIVHVSPKEYTSAEILQAVALNITGGNQGEALAIADRLAASGVTGHA